MTAIIVFVSSLALSVLLVLMKALELRRGKPNPLLGLINKLDARAEKFVAFAKFKCLQLIQSVRYIVLVETRELMRNWLRRAQDRILNEYKARHNIIMGQREIAPNGSASFYLRKITEDKNHSRKGKIQDTL